MNNHFKSDLRHYQTAVIDGESYAFLIELYTEEDGLRRLEMLAEHFGESEDSRKIQDAMRVAEERGLQPGGPPQLDDSTNKLIFDNPNYPGLFREKNSSEGNVECWPEVNRRLYGDIIHDPLDDLSAYVGKRVLLRSIENALDRYGETFPGLPLPWGMRAVSTKELRPLEKSKIRTYCGNIKAAFEVVSNAVNDMNVVNAIDD